jgi:hypothetical protein
MRRILSILVLLAATGPARADDCAFGLSSRYLTDLYCSELRALLDDAQTTRSMNAAPGEVAEIPEGETWSDIGLVRDAYRADPKKTLALIARIRNAGGLVEKH